MNSSMCKPRNSNPSHRNFNVVMIRRITVQLIGGILRIVPSFTLYRFTTTSTTTSPQKTTLSLISNISYNLFFYNFKNIGSLTSLRPSVDDCSTYVCLQCSASHITDCFVAAKRITSPSSFVQST